jgi:hypothetical protein
VTREQEKEREEVENHANDREDRNPSGEHVTDEPICHDLGITSADKELWSKMKFIELLLLIGKTIEVRYDRGAEDHHLCECSFRWI